MDETQDLRHNLRPINDLETHKGSRYKRIALFTLFVVQFLLPNLVLSYGIYAVYFIQRNIRIFDALWPPIIFLATTKISSPWLRVVSESFYEYNSKGLFFIGTFLCSAGVGASYFFTENPLSCGLFYGIFGGFGSSLIISLINCHIDDFFPYEANVVLGIHHLGLSCGLFVMPLIIKCLIEYTSISYVFLIHGSILLHILPLAILLGKEKISREQRLTAYNNFGTSELHEEEMIDMSQNEYKDSLVSRNWKSPSDNFQEDKDNEEIEEPKASSPLSLHKSFPGVNILPKIIEEDEDDTDDEMNKRKSTLLDDNLKRMSVISLKLEEIIQKEEETSILEVKRENKPELVLISPANIEAVNISLSVDKNLNKQNRNCCCTPYQKYRFRRRIKSIFISFYKLFFKPIIRSLQIIEFYPSLLTNIHSMLSPVVFLNFSVFRASSLAKDVNFTELSFMFPMVAFAYLAFLILLPWIMEISKRNLKYIYLIGCMFSAIGIIVCVKNTSDDYIILGCLIYGFGFGMESYLKEIVFKEFLGVSKWSKTENSLECLSGILFIILIYLIKESIRIEDKFNILNYSKKWLDIIFCNHLIVCSIWLIFPLIIYLFDSLFYKNRGKYNFT